MSRREIAIAFGLALATALAYLPALGAGFVDFDDLHLLVDNPAVMSGLQPASIAWAFTTQHGGNYVPLAWLSHLLDATLFGAWAPGHHATSVALHALDAALLFAVLRAMTGAVWRSALAAALFALHPLRVESVAWVSERRDVLSLAFALGSLLAWTRWCRSGARGPWWASLGLFAASLLSKSTWVTLPFVLIVLDRWPLARAPFTRPRLAEKLPFFALTALACLSTLAAQRGAISDFESLPFAFRAANALLAYATYLRQTVWPEGLGILYLHPATIGAGAVLVAAALLAGATALAVWQRDRRPWLLTGWLWYLGTLVPVIGLVQVGVQAHADRYTYVPGIGLAWIVAWAVPDAWLATSRRRAAAATAAALVLLALGLATAAQTRHWQDGVSLYRRALAVDPGNWLAERYLGLALVRRGEPASALRHYDASLAANPRHAPTHYDHAGALRALGREEEARRALEQALALDPDYADAHNALGAALAESGRPDAALPHFERAVALRPDDASFRRNLELARTLVGRGETQP